MTSIMQKMDPSKMKKTRPVDNPYEVWRAGSWEWRVLKKYKKDESDPYARAFCAVSSIGEFTSFLDYDMGDTYISDYERVARLVKVNPDA